MLTSEAKKLVAETTPRILRGREVATREELRGLVEEVEREIGALLAAGHRVRIV